MTRPKYVVGYQGTRLHYVDNGTAVAICGNCCCLYSLTGGVNTHLLWGPSIGLQTSAFHLQQRCIAIAEKGLKPKIHMHLMQNENIEIATLTDVAELEVVIMAFSQTSWRFVTVSGEPDFCLILWDINPSKGATKMIDGKLKNPVKYASFSSSNNNRVCVSGNGHLSIWDYEQSFHVTTWKEHIFQMQPYKPHCHCWASNGDIIYVGCLTGEILSFDVKQPYPKFDNTQEKPLITSECKILFKIAEAKQIVEMCLGQNHLVAIGINGNCYWIGFPIRIKKAKQVEVASKKEGRPRKGEKTIEVVEDEYEPIDPNDYFILEELHLAIGTIVSGEYYEDEKQLLLGSSKGFITTIKVDALHLQTFIVTKAKPQEATHRLVEVMWQSHFHDGPILAMSFINGGKFLVTCGKDGTVRIWSIGWSKEISCQAFKSPQLSLCILNDIDGVAVTGSSGGSLNFFQIQKEGDSGIIYQMKLHTNSIDQIIQSPNSSILLAGSKTDGRLFFLYSKSTQLSKFELLGFTDMLNPIIALTWETKIMTDNELNALVSLARGEIVMLKVPRNRILESQLDFQHNQLQRKSFNIAFPLNAIVSTKCILEKDKVEKSILWGLGKNKNLLQYCLPDAESQWTGPEATPMTPHFSIVGHQKAGTTLVLLQQEQVLVSGAADGCLQIRTNALDPIKPPSKTLDLQIYDSSNAIECLAVHNGLVFTGGENGVLFCIDCSEAGLQRTFKAQNEQPIGTVAVYEHVVENLKQPSLVEEHNQDVEERYMALGEPQRKQFHSILDKMRKDFQEIYEKNLKAPPLEKLTSTKMIVDVDLESKLRKVMDEKVAVAREEGPMLAYKKNIVSKLHVKNNAEIRVSDLNKDILVERIKDNCWNVMTELGTAVWPFGQGYQVWSFPLMGTPVFNLKMALLAKLYRHVEMYEHHYIKLVQEELAKLVAQKAVEQADREAEELAAQQAELEAANVRAFGPPPELSVGDLEADAASEGTFRSERSSRSNQSEAQSEAQDINQEESRNNMVQHEFIQGSIQESIVKDSEIDGESPTNLGPIGPLELELESKLNEEKNVDLEVIESMSASTFLYSYFELTTTKRKRVQRLLLYMVLKDIRVEFNKKLADARATKISHISRIAEMKIRILDLHKMLSQPGEYPWPNLNEVVDGMPNVFEVKNEEILVQKHLNKIEKARAIELKKFEEQEERLRARNNAAERALIDMMGGKLEKKLDIVAEEEEIVCPKWMEGNPKKFTKEQHIEIKAFDAILKQIKDKKDKKLRELEAEQNKLRTNVDELCGTFNSHIEDLFQQRLIDEARCIAIEETISRLSIGIETEEVVDEKIEENMNKHMERLKSMKAQSIASFFNFKKEVDVFQNRYNIALNEDKALDRNFCKNFANCGDAINILYKKFKERPKKKNSSNQQVVVSRVLKKQSRRSTKKMPRLSCSPSQSPSRRTSSTINQTTSTATAAEPVRDPFLERPQEVTPAQWERLLEARGKKMVQEEEVKRLTNIMNSMGGFLAKLTETNESNQKAIEASLYAIADLKDVRERKKNTLEFIIILNAGLIEAILNPLQGNYNDVVLVPRALIEDFNKVILYEANTKIEMLQIAKQIKANNHFVEWEITKNHICQQHSIEKICALQLLRVTKAVQQVIKTGEDPASASESLQLEKRFEHNIRLQNQRVKDKKYVYNKVQEKCNNIKLRNAKLLVKTRLLHLEQNFLNRLCNSGLAAQQKEQALEQRFQAMFKKAQLKNITIQQHNQIQALNQELLKAKNKTVPILNDVDMSGNDFTARPLHSEVGKEVLESIKEYFSSLYFRP